MPPGLLKPLILRLLAERPRHGYELMEEIFERSEGMWRPTAAAIYPTLGWLERRGYIAARAGRPRPGEETARRPYALTDQGRSALDDYRGFGAEWQDGLTRLRRLWW